MDNAIALHQLAFDPIELDFKTGFNKTTFYL